MREVVNGLHSPEDEGLTACRKERIGFPGPPLPGPSLARAGRAPDAPPPQAPHAYRLTGR